MKRTVVRLTLILVGVIIAVSGNLLNHADVGGQEVTVFDEIHCRRIVIEWGDPEEANIVLEVKDGVPSIDINGSYGASFSVKAGESAEMVLQHSDPDTGTTTSELRLSAGKNSTGITHFVDQNESDQPNEQ